MYEHFLQIDIVPELRYRFRLRETKKKKEKKLRNLAINYACVPVFRPFVALLISSGILAEPMKQATCFRKR